MVCLCYAVVTIFLGLYITKLALPLWTKGVMGAFICFHALIEGILAIHMHSDKNTRKAKNIVSIAGENMTILQLYPTNHRTRNVNDIVQILVKSSQGIGTHFVIHFSLTFVVLMGS